MKREDERRALQINRVNRLIKQPLEANLLDEDQLKRTIALYVLPQVRKAEAANPLLASCPQKQEDLELYLALFSLNVLINELGLYSPDLSHECQRVSHKELEASISQWVSWPVSAVSKLLSEQSDRPKKNKQLYCKSKVLGLCRLLGLSNGFAAGLHRRVQALARIVRAEGQRPGDGQRREDSPDDTHKKDENSREDGGKPLLLEYKEGLALKALVPGEEIDSYINELEKWSRQKKLAGIKKKYSTTAETIQEIPEHD